jgi:excisionase family DNA binding protein
MSTTPRAPLPPLDTAQAYSVPEGIAYLRTSRPTLYKLIADGTLKTITRGRRRLIPGSEIARLSQVPS